MEDPINLKLETYKIAAKAIANRFQNVLLKLINSDQTGFLEGSFIGENIRLIDGLINHTAARNIPGLSVNVSRFRKKRLP